MALTLRLWCVILLLPAAQSTAIQVSGSTGTCTWTAANSPYHVTAACTVATGNILTIGRTQFVLRRAAEVQPPASAPVRVTPAAPRPGVPIPSSRPLAARSRRRGRADPLA